MKLVKLILLEAFWNHLKPLKARSNSWNMINMTYQRHLVDPAAAVLLKIIHIWTRGV